MRRGVLGLDRVLVLLLGLVLVVLGVAAIGWQVGFLADVWPDVPDSTSVDSTQVTGDSRFVAIAVAAGVVLVLLGLWWLFAHLPRRGVGPLRLPSGDVPGVLTDLKRLVVRLRVTVYPDADLASVITSCEAVLADLARVLPEEQLTSRVELTVLRRAPERARVQ